MAGEEELWPWERWRIYPGFARLPWWITVDSDIYPFNPRQMLVRYNHRERGDRLSAYTDDCVVCDEKGAILPLAISGM